VNAPTSEEDSRHAQFLNLCLLYGDFNRPVFLEAILRWFVDSASPAELAALRRAIRDRAKSPTHTGKKGRPPADLNWKWICQAAQLVWQREILHWTWRKVAAAAGLKPTKPNFRTLQLRRDRYALLVWGTTAAVGSRDNQPVSLARALEAKSFQRIFRSRLALPFNSHPEESKRIVLALAPRGLHLAANLLSRAPDP
jgi:hypothetical protein